MIRELGPHVSFRRLADGRDGRLPAARAAQVAAHLATGCRECTAADDVLRRALAALAAGPLETPPPALDRSVVRLFRRSVAPYDAGRVVGTLIVDQWVDLVPALRDAGTSARRMLWRVGEHEIDASVHAAGPRYRLMGQVLPPGDDPARAVEGRLEAIRGRRVLATANVGPDGRFTFAALPSGPCTLRGDVDGIAFRLPLLVLA